MFTTRSGGFNDTIRMVLKELRTFLTFVGLVMLGFAFAFYCLFRWVDAIHLQGVRTHFHIHVSPPVSQVHTCEGYKGARVLPVQAGNGTQGRGRMHHVPPGLLAAHC